MRTSHDFIETVVQELSQLHSQLRVSVENVDEEVLAWGPGPDTNSISTLVVHVLGSEAELLNLVAKLPAPRDRASEFAAAPETSDGLLQRIDHADRLLDDLRPALKQADLLRRFIRPSAVRNREPRTALFWLLNGYGHAREHLAHIQLTKQTYDLARRGTPGSA